MVLISLITLASSGVISVQWVNHRPRVSLDKDRIAYISQTLQGLGERFLETGNVSSTLPVATRQSAADAKQIQVAAQQGDTIRIASFNIQVFGTSKSAKPDVMNILAKIVRRFDIVAIQELRTTDPSVMANFIRLINSEGGAYQFVIGPRQGRTDSKEQYVIVYDTQRIEVDPSSVKTVDDPKDLLHREPMIARFRTRASPTIDAFTFILANIHTDPDETKQELNALGDVFLTVQQNPWGEDDVILLGDLNVSYKKLGKLGEIPGIAYTVHGEPTNTRGNKSYDNIVFSSVNTTEYVGRSGIINLQTEFGLTREQALKVSDHYPIWAEFSAYESGTKTLLAKQRAAGAGQAAASGAATGSSGPTGNVVTNKGPAANPAGSPNRTNATQPAPAKVYNPLARQVPSSPQQSQSAYGTSPQYAQPQYAQPQYAQPQYAQPQHAQPQHAQPQHAQPQHAPPQHAQPQHAQPQHAQPQYGATGAAIPSTAQQPHYAAQGQASSTPGQPQAGYSQGSTGAPQSSGAPSTQQKTRPFDRRRIRFLSR